MSDFKTGDPIQVRMFSGNWVDRVFLAAEGDRVFYRTEDNTAYAVPAGYIRKASPVQPFDFVAGDRIRRAARAGERVVIGIGANEAHLAWVDALGRPRTETLALPTYDVWETVPAEIAIWASPRTWKAYRSGRGYRDTDGDTWRFTGHRDSTGTPFVTRRGNLASQTTIAYVETHFGPLVEVA